MARSDPCPTCHAMPHDYPRPVIGRLYECRHTGRLGICEAHPHIADTYRLNTVPLVSFAPGDFLDAHTLCTLDCIDG